MTGNRREDLRHRFASLDDLELIDQVRLEFGGASVALDMIEERARKRAEGAHDNASIGEAVRALCNLQDRTPREVVDHVVSLLAKDQPHAVKLERMRWALTRVAVTFRETKDSRWFGVNVGRRLLAHIEEGASIEDAVQRVLRPNP